MRCKLSDNIGLPLLAFQLFVARLFLTVEGKVGASAQGCMQAKRYPRIFGDISPARYSRTP